MATTMDMAITQELFNACIRSVDVLGNDNEFKQKLESALKQLYPYHIGKYGQLQEWYKDWDDPSDKHRHLSHLFGLHPGSHITLQNAPELAAAAKTIAYPSRRYQHRMVYGMENKLVGKAQRWEPRTKNFKARFDLH